MRSRRCASDAGLPRLLRLPPLLLLLLVRRRFRGEAAIDEPWKEMVAESGVFRFFDSPREVFPFVVPQRHDMALTPQYRRSRHRVG